VLSEVSLLNLLGKIQANISWANLLSEFHF
jgi:hypothetical protein